MKDYAQEAVQVEIQPALDDCEIARLVENYLPLVAKHADRVWVSARLGLTRDDLISAGCYGLLLAARRFDPTRGVGFGVFARSHVHGALMREINSAMKAAGLGGEEVFVAGASEIELDSIADEQSINAHEAMEIAEMRDLMDLLLTEQERLMLTLYYFEELTLAEVAAVTDQPEGAIARALKCALGKLKAAMADKGER
ncbi:MAG TPA: sigma-70 family RNA polymerase sigma factor [Candidatus Binataceae bacterium]|nr:sigma-70 family RNA polymerase sigma factor [Candidatus Binataceae bacterium]